MRGELRASPVVLFVLAFVVRYCILQSIMTAKTLTLRLLPEVYQRAANLARRRNQSLNRLFQEGLELLAAQEQEKQLFDDFSLIAEAGRDKTDMEFALAAQVQASEEK